MTKNEFDKNSIKVSEHDSSTDGQGSG